MERKGFIKKIIIAGAFAAASTMVLGGCSGGSSGGSGSGNTENTSKSAQIKDSLASYPKADMSGYTGLEGYDKDLQFVEMSVQDIKKEMDNKGTFVFWASYSACPYCNTLIQYLNDVALDEGVKVGYLDTRKNPEWKSNMEIDDYDLFVQMFDDYLKLDENEKKHLYVPHTFFIKDGRVVYSHEGVVENLESTSEELSDENKEEVRKAVRKGFESMR